MLIIENLWLLGHGDIMPCDCSPLPTAGRYVTMNEPSADTLLCFTMDLSLGERTDGGGRKRIKTKYITKGNLFRFLEK